MTRSTGLRNVVLVVANVVGVGAFAWPFLVPAALGRERAAGIGTGWILLGLVLCLGVLLFLELGRGGLGPKTVALIGVLGAAMVALRLPGFIAGFSAMFIIVLLGGNAFGPAFGFTLGAVGTFASGLFIGGLGPWLPFQMAAIGWVGLGAGLLPKSSMRVRIVSLAVYGFVVGFAFGAVMNLWSWPYIAGSSALGWDPALGALTNLHHYAAYYVATSLGWDVFRAVGNVVLVVLLGRPLLATLDRAGKRMHLEIGPPPTPALNPKGATAGIPSGA
jgi:energy-coupling factor transport system substrate-specific component